MDEVNQYLVDIPDISSLGRFIEKWGHLGTMAARLEERCVTPFQELKEFRTAILPFLEPLLDYLDQFPPDELPVEVVPIANTVLAINECDKAVTHWRASMLADALDPREFVEKKNELDWDLVK